MSPLVAILILLLLAVVILVVAAPLRDRDADAASGPSPEAASRAPAEAERIESEPRARLARDELEAAREAKYREIRDSELDYRTGKLSRSDYEAVDAQLRAEAIEILDRLERLGPAAPEQGRDG